MLTARKRLRDNAAEAIAQSADRLEAEAQAIRAQDKARALTIWKLSQKLRVQARHIEQQAKRRLRQRKEREWAQLQRERPTPSGITRAKPEPKEWWETD